MRARKPVLALSLALAVTAGLAGCIQVPTAPQFHEGFAPTAGVDGPVTALPQQVGEWILITGDVATGGGYARTEDGTPEISVVVGPAGAASSVALVSPEPSAAEHPTGGATCAPAPAPGGVDCGIVYDAQGVVIKGFATMEETTAFVLAFDEQVA